MTQTDSKWNRQVSATLTSNRAWKTEIAVSGLYILHIGETGSDFDGAAVSVAVNGIPIQVSGQVSVSAAAGDIVAIPEGQELTVTPSGGGGSMSLKCRLAFIPISPF